MDYTSIHVYGHLLSDDILNAVEKDTTTVTFKFAAPPASGVTYTAVILGVQEAS